MVFFQNKDIRWGVNYSNRARISHGTYMAWLPVNCEEPMKRRVAFEIYDVVETMLHNHFR